MKRTSRQVTSKSGTPKGKPKRMKYNADQVAKKIREWRSASSVAERKSPVRSSSFVDRLWLKVDKSDPDAVKKVLDLHASGKGGDEDAIYFSSSRFWHIYKHIQDESLSYFLLSLWSVHLEAAHVGGNSILVGDENCAMFRMGQIHNPSCASQILKYWNTPRLVDWYEIYYNLSFGHISLTDNSEIARNTIAAFNNSYNSDDALFFDRYSQEASIEVQPPDDTDQNLEQTIENLYSQLDRSRPRFLYAKKSEIESTNLGDRVIIVLNVMSDVEYLPPLGWSFQPFTQEPSICIPLEIFEGLGVYDQITLAQRFLNFRGDQAVDGVDAAVDTSNLLKFASKQIQTDPVLSGDVDLHSPPLNFDHNFIPLNNSYPAGGHICRCMACNNFLFEFVQEWGMQLQLESYQIEQTRPYDTNHDFIEIPRGFSQHSEPGLGLIQGAGDHDLNNNVVEKGGNFIQICYTSHTFTEAKTRKRNVDMDRLSQSSPDVESTTTASSISTETQEVPNIRRITPRKTPPKSPVIIIEDEGVPTIVSRGPTNIPPSPNVIILDDEGEQPIINLASSPIVVKQPIQPAREIKTKMGKDSSSYFTPPQTSQSTDEFIKQFYFDNLGLGLERINLDLILQRTTWGGAHDVLEAARVGQHHRIPTAQATALILRVLPIIGSRARGGELDAVNAVGLIKGRLDEFLTPTLVSSSSTPSVTAPVSVPKSSRSGKSRTKSGSKSRSTSPSPIPTTTPDTPTYQPLMQSRGQTEGDELLIEPEDLLQHSGGVIIEGHCLECRAQHRM